MQLSREQKAKSSSPAAAAAAVHSLFTRSSMLPSLLSYQLIGRAQFHSLDNELTGAVLPPVH